MNFKLIAKLSFQSSFFSPQRKFSTQTQSLQDAASESTKVVFPKTVVPTVVETNDRFIAKPKGMITFDMY